MAAYCEREVDSDLGGSLENLVDVHDNFPTPVVQVVILDGAAIVNMFPPDFADMFVIYDPSVPSVRHITTAACEQTIVVWDEHLADSLKAEARTKRGKCIRSSVSLH